MKPTSVLPGFEGLSTRTTPTRSVPTPEVRASDDSITQASGVVLWGPLLDRLGLVEEADRRGVRRIGPGGYTGGPCYRTLVEMLLAGGDFLSDRSLLDDEATTRLRGDQPFPSHTTMWRFLAGAHFGRVEAMAAVNREMLRRAWAAGAAPEPGLLTIDPDATVVRTYGVNKEGSSWTYLGKPGMHPLLGVIGETGEVLAVRARGGRAQAGRKLASFTAECIDAVPEEVRANYQLWVRSDSAGYQREVIEAAEAKGAVWTVTAKRFPNVDQAIHALATDPTVVWVNAEGTGNERGSQIADTTFAFAGRTVRLIVRRQPVERGAQLAFDDYDAYRYRAIITNIPAFLGSAEAVEAHHRLRGGIPEAAVKELKHDFGFCHAPLENFFGNWCWWVGCALAYNCSLWLQTLALPRSFRRARGKRLRLHILNVPARVTTSGRRLRLNFSRAYRYAGAFAEALRRVRALPAFIS